MSSTNRGGQRSEADFYVTPPWVIHRFLDRKQLYYADEAERKQKEWQNLPGGRWLEPCAGDGELIRTVNSRRSDIIWSAAELREEMKPNLEPLVHDQLYLGDFLGLNLEAFGGKKFDVAITNPPFNIAMAVVKKCMEVANMTIMLLRLNFWGSDERQVFMKRFPPHTYVLPNRPMFSLNKKGKPGTDSPEYAWMVWNDPQWFETATCGDIEVLNRTSKEERRKWSDHLRSMAAKPALEVAAPGFSAEPAHGVLSGNRDL